MKLPPVPSLQGTNLVGWASTLVAFLKTLVREIETPGPKVIQLEHQMDGASATQDGLLMWSPTAGTIVVSKNGQWYPVQLGTPLLVIRGASRL